MPRGLIVISHYQNGATNVGTEDDDKFPRSGEKSLSLELRNEGFPFREYLTCLLHTALSVYLSLAYPTALYSTDSARSS
jgi:hypothetical protein